MHKAFSSGSYNDAKNSSDFDHVKQRWEQKFRQMKYFNNKMNNPMLKTTSKRTVRKALSSDIGERRGWMEMVNAFVNSMFDPPGSFDNSQSSKSVPFVVGQSSGISSCGPGGCG